jgi:hypothetical protein
MLAEVHGAVHASNADRTRNAAIAAALALGEPQAGEFSGISEEQLMRVASVPVTIVASLLLATRAGLVFAQGGGGGGAGGGGAGGAGGAASGAAGGSTGGAGMSSGSTGGTNSATTPGSQGQPGATMNNNSSATSNPGTTGSGLNNGLNRAPCGSTASGGVGSGNNTALGQTPRISTDTNPTTGTNQTIRRAVPVRAAAAEINAIMRRVGKGGPPVRVTQRCRPRRAHAARGNSAWARRDAERADPLASQPPLPTLRSLGEKERRRFAV